MQSLHKSFLRYLLKGFLHRFHGASGEKGLTCPFFNGIMIKHMCRLKFRFARTHLNSEKEEPVYENDISAENKTEKEGTWFSQENEYQKWQKCFKEKKTKR